MASKSQRNYDHPDSRPKKQGLRRLSDLFGLLGSDPEQNIRTIVQQTYKLINSASSLYNRMDEKQGSLVCWAGYRLPPDFPPEDVPFGRIYMESNLQNDNQPVVIDNLLESPFQASDPFFRHYGLKSYLGCPVICDGKAIGSLCVVDTQVRKFEETDLDTISTLAKAIALEEKRLAAERALRDSEKKYRHLFKMLRLLTDNVPDLIWAKDLEGRYTFANQAVCDKLLKCRYPDDAIGKSDRDFARQEQSEGHEYTFGQCSLETDMEVKQKQDAGRFLEEGIVRSQRLILDIHKAPFWDEYGRLIGMVGCGRDVTKEKQIEQALQKSEKRYRNLYCNTPVMLFSMDHEDRLASVSNYWLDIMGYQSDEAIGRPLIDFFSPASRQEALEKAFPKFYKTGQMTNYPVQLVTKNGDIKEVLLSTLAERDTQGNYLGAMAFMVDLTDVSRAEQKNRQLSVRLQQAQKMESIATLAGGIAHQFNNALAVILGNLELIQMDGLDGENMQRFIAPIDEAGHRMVQLTSQLLAFARGGKFQTQILPAHAFVRDTLKLVSHSMSANIDLVTELNENTDHIEVDQTQMQMLLTAILANATEAIEDKGRIHISLTNTLVTEQECNQYPGLRPGPMVRLRIADNGRGMEEDIRTRIFEPFFTTKFTGRGLGMAAVYGIAKKHNGYIYVDSAVDQGTTVTIYLPCSIPISQVEEEAPSYTTMHMGTALIIEDEKMVMDVSRAIIEKLGYRVLEAVSGKEAIDIAENHPEHIDFALLDIILPDMNGNQIYPQIMKARPNLKVIVCSGFAQDGPAAEILEAGADNFIQKPFSASAISAALKTAFQTEESDPPEENSAVNKPTMDEPSEAHSKDKP